MLIIIITICLLFLYFLMHHLIQQSKNPTGILGKGMMKIWNYTYFPMYVWATRQLDKNDVHRILDVGVGNGRSSIFLKEIYPRSTVIGIDSSATAISEAKDSESLNLKFERKDVRKTGYPDETFDLITGFQTHFHWEDIETSFTELRRVLTSDGLLLLACEWQKLVYFLPQFRVEDEFSKFLSSKGLNILTSQKSGRWILYKIVKETN